MLLLLHPKAVRLAQWDIFKINQVKPYAQYVRLGNIQGK
jgi:hypothetical protein